MKILIASDTYYPDVNGASYFTQRLAEYLAQAGHSVFVVAASTTFRETRTERNGVTIMGMPSLPILFYSGFRFTLPIFLGKRLRKIIREIDPDIIHIQNHFIIGRWIVPAAQACSVSVVATNHFMPDNLTHYLRMPQKITNVIDEFMWSDFAKIFNQVSFVTTPTHIAAGLIQHRLTTPVTPVSCGIDLIRFSPNNDGTYLRNRYQFPDKPILMYVGRLDKEKHIDDILHAMKKVIEKLDICFVIAGNGAERKNLESLSEHLGIRDHILFLGFVPDADLQNLYPLADCFVIASTAELQSIVTMEAMASGLPVIGADAAALPELIQDQENGLLFPARNIDALAEKIIRMFSDSPFRLRAKRKSLENIQRHDIKTTIKRFEEIYQQNSSKK